MKDSCSLHTEPDELFEQLEKAGFESSTIYQAMDWLDKLIKDNTQFIQIPQTLSTRVFTSYEKEFIDFKCERFLISLEQLEILTPETREIVINQILMLDPEGIDLPLIKWITLMVLFNRTDSDNALACMEFLVLDDTHGGVH